MKVYQLHEGGRGSWSDKGLFATITRAKEQAATILDTYHEFDGHEDTEQTDYNATWQMKRETIGGRGTHEIGAPKPFLVYGDEGSAFKITEREVLE